MLLRLEYEKRERDLLASFATFACASQGRRHPEPKCQVRTEFQRDRDRIIHSKSFRRLKSKTQVFIAPEGDHYRTRLTHTLEVAQISRTVARALSLNEDLVEAIALGHDLGHTPFGHAGEIALNRITGHFRHNEQSLRVVDILENSSLSFTGLNLTAEVRDGILCHTGPELPETLEGQIVRICDRVAYLNHDIEDALRGKVIQEADLPVSVTKVLGKSRSQRINTMVKDIVVCSKGKSQISTSKDIAGVMDELRHFLFDRVYIGSVAKREENKIYQLVKLLYEYYVDNPKVFIENAEWPVVPSDIDIAVVDYIAGMTDCYAIAEFEKLFLPQGWTHY